METQAMFEKMTGGFEGKETKEKRERVLSEIEALGKELNNLKGREGIETIVQFFNAISAVQDSLDPSTTAEIRSYLQKKKKEAAEKFDDLCKHIANSGREKFGWNRTKKGEVVTEDKVYLGNISGLFTKSVDYWKGQKGEAKGGWGFSGMENLNAYDVVNNQAREFMQSHSGEMIEDINIINATRKG